MADYHAVLSSSKSCEGNSEQIFQQLENMEMKLLFKKLL